MSTCVLTTCSMNWRTSRADEETRKTMCRYGNAQEAEFPCEAMTELPQIARRRIARVRTTYRLPKAANDGTEFRRPRSRKGGSR
jgi:hypothetical protein